jgi:hypothetical protein
MPKNLTKFNTSLLSRVDANNDPVDVWLKKGSISTTFKCSLCQTNDLDKLRLKRKDAFLHDQTTNKKMKQLQEKQRSSTEIIDDSM